MMVLLDGEPFGKAGSRCKPSWMVFTLLFISVCKLWVRIRATSRGLLERLGLLVHRRTTLLLRYSNCHCSRGGSRGHNGDSHRPARTGASVGGVRTPSRFGSYMPGSPAHFSTSPLKAVIAKCQSSQFVSIFFSHC